MRLRAVAGFCALLTFVGILGACAIAMPWAVRTYYAWNVPQDEIADAGFAWELMTLSPALGPFAIVLGVVGALAVYFGVGRQAN